MTTNFRPWSLNQKVQIYFEKIENKGLNKTHICLIEGCNTALAGEKACNLVAHIKSVHFELYKKIAKTPSQTANFCELKKLKFIQNCVEIIAINLRPYSYLNDSGFVKSHEDILSTMAEGGHPINLNDKNHPEIKEVVDSLSEKIKDFIKDEVIDELLSLMIDITTKNHIPFLGITVQFVKTGKLQIRCIALTPMPEAHTAENIIFKIKQCFMPYGIKMRQIISMTTDNANNMVSMTNIINKSVYDDDADDIIQIAGESETTGALQINGNQVDCQNDMPDDIDDDFLRTLAAQFEQMDEDELDEYLDDDTILEEVVDGLNVFSRDTVGIKCASHTLQLAVKEAISKSNALTLINFCRTVVKLLRQQTYISKIKALNLSCIVPRIDCKTRWSYTYIMLDNMIQCKHVIQHFAKDEHIFAVACRKWEAIVETRNILQILYEATNASQKPDLTLSDFYGCWLHCTLQLQQFREIKCNLANALVSAMNKRRPALFENIMMISAIFLDPRFKSELTEEQYEKAKEHLSTFWINHIQKREETCLNNGEGEKKDLIEDYFKSKGCQSITTNSSHDDGASQTRSKLPVYSLTRVEMLECLEEFKNEPRIHHSVSILKFWENTKIKYPELYLIAKAINGIPPSQATVERHFSALSLLFTNRRSQLSHKAVENLLIIKLNEEIAHAIFEEEIQKLKDVHKKQKKSAKERKVSDTLNEI